MKSCVYCGTSPVSRKFCAGCRKKRAAEQQAAWNKAHPENGRAAQRRYRERYPERVTKRKAMFGVSESEFSSKLTCQGNRCAICGTDNLGSDRGWNFDHDHSKAPKDKSGHRGILCRSCNLMLGNAKDDPIILKAAIEYLDAWGKRI